MRYYKRIIGCGDYVGYYEALGKCRSEVQRDIIKAVHDEGSVYMAERKYINIGDNKRKQGKKFSAVIKTLSVSE